MNTCTAEGCDRAHRARGLCASHYNQTHRKDQHREVPCVVCGTLVVKNGPGIKRRSVCSERCRYAVTHGHDIAEHREIVGPVERRIVRTVPVEAPKPNLPSITNVVPCCRSCNTDKRTLTLSEWATDRIRRGRVPLYIDPRVTHLTDALLVA